MALASTTNPADFANQQQTFLNKKILAALLFNLKLAGYGQSEGYEAHGNTIRFFRPRKANVSGINAAALTGLAVTPLVTPTVLTEGVKPTNLTEVGVGYVDIKMTQRAGYTELTDQMQALALLNYLAIYTKTLGDDAALDYDTVIRNWLISALYNSNAKDANGNDGGYFERFAGVPNTGVSATDFTTLTGVTKANGKMTRDAALGMITQLKTSKIPKIGGKYVAVVSPQVVHDMRKDTTWLQTAIYQDKENLYKDLQFILDGAAYVEASNPWIEAGVYGTESITDPGDGLIYSTIFLGADAFGIPSLNNKMAGGNQQAPKIYVLNSADKADPINQKTTVGWKSYFGAGAFIATSDGTTRFSGERPRYGILRTKSTFV